MFRWRLNSTYPTIWGLAAFVNTQSQGEDVQAEKMYGLHHWTLFRLIEAAQAVSISTCACFWAKWSRLPWEPGVKQYERENDRPICLCMVVCVSLCTSGAETREWVNLCSVLIGAKQKNRKNETEIETKRKYLKAFARRTYTLAPCCLSPWGVR